MTIQRWLAAREPAPPEALSARLAALLAAEAERPASDACEVFLAAAERLVAGLLDTNCTSRDGALDLLAADALVTYAFEAAADRPADLVPRAANAMRRMATLGGAPAAQPAGA